MSKMKLNSSVIGGYISKTYIMIFHTIFYLNARYVSPHSSRDCDQSNELLWESKVKTVLTKSVKALLYIKTFCTYKLNYVLKSSTRCERQEHGAPLKEAENCVGPHSQVADAIVDTSMGRTQSCLTRGVN